MDHPKNTSQGERPYYFQLPRSPKVNASQIARLLATSQPKISPLDGKLELLSYQGNNLDRPSRAISVSNES